MPSNILTTDTSFPNLNGNQSTDEKFRLITNYLYMLLEQLRYSMANLGLENFNEKEFDDIVNLITEPVYVQLSDLEGNVSSLTVTAEQLNSRMSDAEGNISTLQQTSNSIMSQVSDLEGNVSTLQQTSQALSTRISNAEGDISSLTQTVNGFTLSVTNGTESSTIKLMSGSTQISSQVIQMSGMVTFTDLSGNGTTVINGNNITTGTISANRLDLTGAITFSDLSASVRNDINDAYTMAEDAQDTVGGWVYRGTTYIDGTQIMTGTVSASTLEGGEIYLLDNRGREAGSFTLEGSSSSAGQKVLVTSGAIELDAADGDIYLGLYSGSAGYVQISDGEVTIGRCDLQPNLDDRYYCGTNRQRWSAVYAATAEIVTSDRNLKNSISYDMRRYDGLFDLLKPTPYKYNNGTSDRTHLGMISQDVEDALTACGMTGKDFAGFVKGEDADGNPLYSLRYEEFIALCIDQIQKLKKRVDELEGRA